jgi:hypothetical protein
MTIGGIVRLVILVVLFQAAKYVVLAGLGRP